MTKLPIVHVVAMDRDNGIGLNNSLPWPKIPADMKRFKQLTLNNPILMGAKTYLSIGKTLPNRTNIVITKSPQEYQIPELIVKTNIPEALDYASKVPLAKAIYIIGGGELYRQTMDLVDVIQLTLVHGHYLTDTRYPEVSNSNFNEISRSEIIGDPCLTFVTLERRS